MADPIVLTCGDNFIYLHPCGDGRVLVVDPGVAAGVLAVLERQDLTLAAILTTHHHGDHIGGVGELKARTQCEVVGPDRQSIPGIDRIVSDGDVLAFGPDKITVLATPGHTRTSVCYHLPASPGGHGGVVFTGDTLFVGGCGRPMECDARTMWQSLVRLAALPDETRVYCGHDYTLESYDFALTIEPANPVVQNRRAELQAAVAQGGRTVPSTIAQEKATNIFLRASDAQVQSAVGMAGAAPEAVFAKLRQRKNAFG